MNYSLARDEVTGLGEMQEARHILSGGGRRGGVGVGGYYGTMNMGSVVMKVSCVGTGSRFCSFVVTLWPMLALLFHLAVSATA